jgi:hypothetical protein
VEAAGLLHDMEGVAKSDVRGRLRIRQNGISYQGCRWPREKDRRTLEADRDMDGIASRSSCRYISWEQFERNQTMLGDNAHMKSRMEPKAGRGGRSLLAGLLRCRRCGRMLHVALAALTARCLAITVVAPKSTTARTGVSRLAG